MLLLLLFVSAIHSQDREMLRVGGHLTGWFVCSSLALCPALFWGQDRFIPHLWPRRFQASQAQPLTV